MKKVEWSLNEWLKQAFIQLIARHTGLVIREQDQAALSEKIFLRMKALELDFPETYYQLLDAPTFESHQEWQKLVLHLTNLESYFFRDKGQFILLRNCILPELINRKQDSKILRIYSAGCSTGEEPYSLAILLKELIPDLEQWELLILGTDINQEALEKAQTGIYSPWSFRSVKEDIKQKYFRSIQKQYQIDPQIRKMVKFQTLNLVKDPFPQLDSDLSELDLIICRNVFIYFEEAAIAKVIDKYYQTLQPLGYLITGHAELYGQNLNQFQTKIFPESLVYQRPVDNLVNEPPASLTTEQGLPSSNEDNFLPSDLKIDAGTRGCGDGERGILMHGDEKNFFIATDSCPLPFQAKISSTQTDRTITASSKQPHPLSSGSSKTETNFNQETDQELLRKAQILLRQKAYNLAIRQVNKVLQKNPNNCYAYYLMAKIQVNLHQYKEATHYCHEALEIDSFFIEPHYLLAQIAQEQNNLVEAKRLLKQIIYLEPYSLVAYFQLSHIYQQEGDEKRSIKMQQALLNILKQLPANAKILELGNLTAAELILELETTLQVSDNGGSSE